MFGVGVGERKSMSHKSSKDDVQVKRGLCCQTKEEATDERVKTDC